MTTARGLFGGVIVLYFIIALEVLIMISPFAAFFYAAFNPVLLFLAHWPATRWLAAFFLPHMVLPPGPLLQTLRIAGSVFFVGGTVVFLVCAAQVYFHKLLRRGPALAGLYRWIRHPQYLALGFAGLGLAILWPRFLTLALWTIMAALYYLLARDEERRMVNQFGDQYRDYMTRTGRFFPRSIERLASRLLPSSPSALRPLASFVLLLIAALGSAFLLRAYTVARLPLWSEGRVTAIAILPADSAMLEHRMAAVLGLPEINAKLPELPGAILVYLVPRDYVMQGMIADTDPQWRLYQHHGTIAMITDWVFHPFRHLEQGGHGMMHEHAGAAPVQNAATDSMVRRLIFLRVDTPRQQRTRRAIFGINTTRVPAFFADVDLRTLAVLKLHELGPGTGWGQVPTPMF